GGDRPVPRRHRAGAHRPCVRHRPLHVRLRRAGRAGRAPGQRAPGPRRAEALLGPRALRAPQGLPPGRGGALPGRGSRLHAGDRRRRLLRARTGQRGPAGHRGLPARAGLRRLVDGGAGRDPRHGHAAGERRAQPRGAARPGAVTGAGGDDLATGAELARGRHVARRAPGSGGDVVVTPETAGWEHLWFEVRTLQPGQRFEHVEERRETCVVVLSGSGVLELNGEEKRFAGRASPFAGLPHALYAPPRTPCGVRAETAVELGIGGAAASGRLPPRFIGPGDVKVEMRGGHNALRQITHVLDPGDAERLLCVEVYTPSGNWSSYPPHRHDEHVPGVEVDLDEVYHYRRAPPGGFALQRLYDDARDLDDVVVVRDGD